MTRLVRVFFLPEESDTVSVISLVVSDSPNKIILDIVDTVHICGIVESNNETDIPIWLRLPSVK